MIFDHWVDFVIHPWNADRVRSREERLATHSLPHLWVDGKPNPNYRVGEAAVVTAFDLIRLDDPAHPGDEFEAMEVSDLGRVTIWTKHWVCSLARLRGNEMVGEKIIRLPRHPRGGAVPSRPEIS